MNSGVWAKLTMLPDPESCWLVRSLPSTVLGSCADSTVANYGYAFQHWKTWTELYAEATVFPINDVHFAPYMQHLSETIGS